MIHDNTPIMYTPAEPILKKIDEIEAVLKRIIDNTDGTDSPCWLPIKKLAYRYGISRPSAMLHIAAALSAGKMRAIQPPTADGLRQGRSLYNVADFHNWITRQDKDN